MNICTGNKGRERKTTCSNKINRVHAIIAAPAFDDFNLTPASEYPVPPCIHDCGIVGTLAK